MADDTGLLPVVDLPADSVEVGGVAVPYRALSRTEGSKVVHGFTAEAMPGVPVEERADAAEVYIIACGTGVTLEQARAWRDQTTSIEAGKVIDGILILSGLGEGQGDPKDPTSGR